MYERIQNDVEKKLEAVLDYAIWLFRTASGAGRMPDRTSRRLLQRTVSSEK
jgi:hypothetical protein